jgi:hypothetical protein
MKEKYLNYSCLHKTENSSKVLKAGKESPLWTLANA